MRRTSDAASLQNELAKRLGLPHVSNPLAKGRSSGNGKSSSSRGSKLRVVAATYFTCRACGTEASSSLACTRCGLATLTSAATSTMRSREKNSTSTSSSSSSLTGMSAMDWEVLERSLASRGDAVCPICMEHFSEGHEVLLSCSHTFHRACLASFERFVKISQRRCPICRACQYEKRITHHGSKAFEEVCALRVQRLWRGHYARLLTHQRYLVFYKEGRGGPRLRRRFFLRELQTTSCEVEAEIVSRASGVETLLSASDSSLQQSRELGNEFDRMLVLRSLGRPSEATSRVSINGEVPLLDINKIDKMSEEEWESVLLQCLKREGRDCAICMCPLLGGGGDLGGFDMRRRSVLLSCSHVFHDRCVTRFEVLLREHALLDGAPCRCPVCRSPYSKRLLASDQCHFL